jgi:H+/Cl- antiporter ClcA
MDKDIKRVIYLFLTVVFGLLLALIVCVLLVPIALIYDFAKLDTEGLWILMLPIWVPVSIFSLGGVWGYRVGVEWWRIVYIEHRHWRFRKQRKAENIS